MPAHLAPGCHSLRYKAAREWFYHKSRLNYPLKRIDARGENRWQRIEWQQALDEIAARLATLRKRFGAETLVTSKGDDWTHSEYETRFMSLFGSPNIIGPSPICWGPRALVSEAIFGWHPIYSIKPHTKCIVMLGVNIDVGRPVLIKVTREAVKNGAKIITIDPRRSSIAQRSELWLQIKPGTDAAVLLALINHIIGNDLYDKDFVTRWCHGFDALKQRASLYPLKRVEKISGVPARLLAKAAQIYAQNKPGVIFEGMGVEQQINSAQIMQARCILAGITGNVDVEGGEELDGPHPRYVSDREIELLDLLGDEQKKKQIAYNSFRLHSWPGQDLMTTTVRTYYGQRGGSHWYLGQTNLPAVYRAIMTAQPYPLKAMIVSASNPLVSHPDTGLVYSALKKLDLLVVMDLCWTPTAQIADYVLPATSWFERPMLYTESGFGKVMEIIEPVLPSVTSSYNRKNDFDLWRELGVRLGQEEYWPWRTVADSYNQKLRLRGVSFTHMASRRHVEDVRSGYKKYEKKGFATPTAKVEFVSTVFEKLGYDPLPYYTPPQREHGDEYPLTMINGARIHYYMLSMWRNIESVRKEYQHPLVQIHPETACEYGIEEGEWIWIESKNRRIRQKCVLFDGVSRDVIHCDGQWWYPELPGEEPLLHGVWLSNVNVLLCADPAACNEVLGSWAQRIAKVKIYKEKRL